MIETQQAAVQAAGDGHAFAWFLGVILIFAVVAATLGARLKPKS